MISRRLTSQITRIPLAWSNVYALTDPLTFETTLIDTGLQKDLPRLLEGLAEIGVSPQKVRRVLLTHGHCDHAGNAAYFAAKGAEIVAHSRELPYLLKPRRTYAPTGLRRFSRLLSTLLFFAGEKLYPVERMERVTPCENGDVIFTPLGDLEAIHSPGHTPGHLAFLHREKDILFSGDAILNIIPVKLTASPSLPLRVFTEDWSEAKLSAQSLVALRPEQMLSGHGSPLKENTTKILQKWARTLRM